MSLDEYERGDDTLAERATDLVVTAAVEVVLRTAAVVIAVRAWWRGEPYDFNPLRTAPRRARTDQPTK